ncbi:MAG: hypothetical protein HZR80_16940 [Candidatus Heimdallarchaeota archaeon]
MKITKKERILQEVIKIITTYKRKLKLRQIYYRLVAKQIIENTTSQYKQLSKILVEAREKGIINPELIIDGSRTQPIIPLPEYYCHVDHFCDYFDFFLKLPENYHISRWYNQPNYVIINLEKDALSSIFIEIIEELECGFVIGKGFNSYSQLYETMKKAKQVLNFSKIIFLHFGDFDPSGKDIIRSFQDRIERMGIESTHKIIALTDEQIINYQLPSVPTKKTDSRAKKFIEKFGDRAVELDALEPDVLENMISDSVNDYFDQNIYNETLAIENQNKSLLQKTMTVVREKIGTSNDYMTSLQEEDIEE